MDKKATVKPDSVDKPVVPENTKSQLPEPMGFKVLVAMPQAEEKTEGGILKASQTIRDEEVSNICGYVLKLGPDAYNDKNRFPSGPWCKEGDWIIITKYAGSRIKIDGGELRIINDDEVLAVVDDPRDILPPNLI